MTCGKVYNYICENLDERIDSARCRRIREHLAKCPVCRKYLQSMKTTVRLFQVLPVPPVPPSVHREVLRSLETLRRTEGAAGPARRTRTRQR